MKNKKFKMREITKIIGYAASVSLLSGVSFAPQVLAQDQSAADLEEVLVTGQRKSIESAQAIKKESMQIVDSVSSDDLGKLPDRSVTDLLSRLPGVAVNGFMNLSDPEHFSGEGSGVAIRGLTHIQSTLNGRESFSAAGGRSLSFEDVPTELMSGVDVYKNPTADMIEGGLAGVVNLRTRMPFDSDGQMIGATLGANYGDFVEETDPAYSLLYSNNWETEIGRVGILLDVAQSEVSTRTDSIFTRPMFERSDIAGHLGEKLQVPRGADYRSQQFNRERTGSYVALQWAPSDTLETFFTYFNSQYDFQWHEDAIFVSNDPLKIIPSADSVYDAGGVFRKGTLTDSAGLGIPMGADIMLNDGRSETTDYSLGAKWSPDENWQFNVGLQRVESTNNSFNSTVATAIEVPYLDLDFTGEYPSVRSDNTTLADPANYSWGFTMDIHNKNIAEQTAFNIDAEYFVADSFIKSVKAGVRVTDREADNIDGSLWAGVYQDWMRGWALPGDQPLPPLAGEDLNRVKLNTFDNFFRGKADRPAGVLAPKPEVALGYPQSFQDLHDSAVYLPNGEGLPSIQYNALDLDDPQWSNDQSEETQAIYVMANWTLEGADLPVDGSIGVRHVKTDSVAYGSLQYPSSGWGTWSDVASEDIAASNSYSNTLPSFNLRWKIQDDLIARMAISQAIVRPGFAQTKAHQSLSAGRRDNVPSDAIPVVENTNFTSTSDYNPYLKPIEADQLDVSLEWYFNEHGGMLHGTLFYKELEGFFRKNTTYEEYKGITYTVARPINTGTATIEGIEIGYNQFFDMLPAPWDGFGVQTNYTYIGSDTEVDATVAPVDTNGNSYGSLPYEGLSRHTYNLTVLFEKGDWSTRLAYNYRSEYLMSVGANGYNGSNPYGGANVDWKLPVYQDGRYQVDGSINYKINENFTASIEVNNITAEDTVTYADQTYQGPKTGAFFVNDRRYALTLRANF